MEGLTEFELIEGFTGDDFIAGSTAEDIAGDNFVESFAFIGFPLFTLTLSLLPVTRARGGQGDPDLVESPISICVYSPSSFVAHVTRCTRDA